MKHLIIGMGSIGKRHYRLLKEAGQEVIGIDKNGIPDWDVDMAWICTPTFYHFEHALDAIKKVKLVFIEKPVSKIIVEAEAIKKVARETGCKVYVAANYRFHPAVQAFKDKLHLVGKVIYSRMHFSHYLPYQRENWLEYVEDNPIRRDVGIHFVDLALWLFGKVEVWNNMDNSLELNCDDTTQFWLHHKDSSTYIWGDYLRRDKSWGIEVIGTEGTLTLKSINLKTAVVFTARDSASIISCGFNEPDEMYRNQLNYLLKGNWQSNAAEHIEALKICV